MIQCGLIWHRTFISCSTNSMWIILVTNFHLLVFSGISEHTGKQKIHESLAVFKLFAFRSCGAVCLYQSEENACRITLSEPLLRSRPRTDLIETLLVRLFQSFHNNHLISFHLARNDPCLLVHYKTNTSNEFIYFCWIWELISDFRIVVFTMKIFYTTCYESMIWVAWISK